MAKPYEIHGIPENIWLEFDEPPDYAVIYDDDDEDEDVDDEDQDVGTSIYEMYPKDVWCWGQAERWTALEAALLIAGVLPDNLDLYAVNRRALCEEDVVATGKSFEYHWKYTPMFNSAQDYLFLFERSPLAPNAPPIEWVKYFNRKVRDASMPSVTGSASCILYKPIYCDDWLEFFAVELNADNQSETTAPTTVARTGRRETQHEIILAVIVELEFDPLQIPERGKSKIKSACLTHPRWFTPDGFSHAWKAGVSAGLFKLANHEKYSSK